MAVTLAAVEHGAGPPVLVLHGLFGAAANWATIARALGAEFHVFALDLRNHGASPWEARMDYRAQAEDVAAFMAARGIGRAALLGHSMGGKTAMVLALTAPALVERLVVVDIAPVPRPVVHAEEVAAMQSLDLRGVARRAVADQMLKPRIPDDAVRQFLLTNLMSGPDGLRWRINLDAIAGDMAAIAGFPAFPPGAVYRGKVLVVRGEASAYVADADRAAFARLFPAYRMVAIAGAGHWVHAEQPAAFLAAVKPFLAGA